VSLTRNAVEQLAGLLGGKHGRLAFFDDVFGTAHGVGRIHVDDVADHQPVEQHAERGQVLLNRGRRKWFLLQFLVLQVLDECGDMEGLDAGELSDSVALAPFREAPCRVQIRLARVVVLDLSGEKFEHALGGFGRWREEWRGKHGGGRGEDELVHSTFPLKSNLATTAETWFSYPCCAMRCRRSRSQGLAQRNSFGMGDFSSACTLFAACGGELPREAKNVATRIQA